MSNYDFDEAHHCSIYNRTEIEKDNTCGCFFCLKIFNPKEIEKWCDKGQTAICPYCDIDSVIGESSGFPITNEFLEKMKKHFF